MVLYLFTCAIYDVCNFICHHKFQVLHENSFLSDSCLIYERKTMHQKLEQVLYRLNSCNLIDSTPHRKEQRQSLIGSVQLVATVSQNRQLEDT